jgi:hypothetical protein
VFKPAEQRHRPRVAAAGESAWWNAECVTGIDNATASDPNPSSSPDQVGLTVADGSGNTVTDLTFTPVDVSFGNIYVGP